MKNIVYAFIAGMLLLPLNSMAQTEEAGDATAIWVYPQVYNLDEKASWYFDFSNTTFAENEDLYLWIWEPSEPDAGNWDASSDFAKLNYVKDGVWRMDMVATEYFNMTVEAIKAKTDKFWMRVKNFDGSKQSGVMSIELPSLADFIASNKMYAVIPTNFTVTTDISILFNANLTDNPAAFTEASGVYMHSGLNDWEVLQEYQSWLPEIVAKVKAVDMGGGIFRKDLTPYQYYGVDGEYDLVRINFLFVAGDWAKTSPDGEFNAGGSEVLPPVFSIFPLKVSIDDVLMVNRTNNDRGQRLKYTLTAGGKTETAELLPTNVDLGYMHEQRAYINLPALLNGTGATKIHLLVNDQNGRVVFDGDISLETVDKPKK